MKRFLVLLISAAFLVGTGSSAAGCGSGCTNTTSFAGKNDNFSTSDGLEAMTPPPGFPPTGQSASQGFDVQNHNRVFAQRLYVPVPSGKCLTKESLEIHLMPTPPGGPPNDTIALQAGAAKWSAYLGKPRSTSPPTLLPTAWNTVTDHTFTLDLSALPGGVNLLGDIAVNQYLDVIVADDTAVDYIRWDSEVCKCATPPTKAVSTGIPASIPASATPTPRPTATKLPTSSPNPVTPVGVTPSPVPTAVPTAAPTATPTPTLTPRPTDSPTPSVTPRPTPTPCVPGGGVVCLYTPSQSTLPTPLLPND